MARTAKLSKSAIIERLAGVFESSGYAGASLKMLADAASLSKASLYHYFPGGKAEMAAHVLAQAGGRLQNLVLGPLKDDAPASERLFESLEGTARYYSGSVPVCLMNSLLLGGGTALFGDQVKSAVTIWQTGLASAYREAGADSREASAWAAYAVERIQGALILCRVTCSRRPFETCLAELKADVEQLIS
jgi:AcrR family transcriptional regulator